MVYPDLIAWKEYYDSNPEFNAWTMGMSEFQRLELYQEGVKLLYLADSPLSPSEVMERLVTDEQVPDR